VLAEDHGETRWATVLRRNCAVWFGSLTASSADEDLYDGGWASSSAGVFLHEVLTPHRPGEMTACGRRSSRFHAIHRHRQAQPHRKKTLARVQRKGGRISSHQQLGVVRQELQFNWNQFLPTMESWRERADPVCVAGDFHLA